MKENLVANLTYNVDSLKNLHSDEMSLSHDRVEIKLVKNCGRCNCNNFYIWGTIINDEFNLELRCIKCGNKVSSIKSYLNGVDKNAS